MQSDCTYKVIDNEVYKKTCVYKFSISDSVETPGIMLMIDNWYRSDLGDFVLKNMFGNTQVLSHLEIHTYSHRVHVIAWLKLSDLTYIQLKWPEADFAFE